MFTVGTSEDTLYSKSISMQIWLLGYEMTETIGGEGERVCVLSCFCTFALVNHESNPNVIYSCVVAIDNKACRLSPNILSFLIHALSLCRHHPLTPTAVVTKDKHVMFLTSQKKAIFLSPLKV